MTPEQIAKEQEASKSNPIKPASTIQPNKADIEEPVLSTTELKTIKPIDITPPAESDKEYARKVKDYKTIVSEAKSKGIDLNDQEGVPLLDSDKERIIQNVSKLAPKELITNAVNRINTYAQPELKKVPELDQKRLMDQERRIRRARWADALYAFGEGLQGRVANPETFATTRLQRKKDQEFQDYLNVTEQNRKVRNAWNAQTTDETIKWLDEQANNERLDRLTREKMAEAANQFREKLKRQDRDFTEKKRHNIAMENKPTGAQDKENKPVKIKTAQKTYELQPEEADFYKGKFIENIGQYADKFPGTIVKVQKTNQYTGEPIEGQYEYKLTKPIKDSDLIRAVLENDELNERRDFTSNLFNKSTLPTSQQPTQNQSKLKADPLGLGL